MSLIAWYPLIVNTNDYSGNNLNAINNNAVIDNNGKIGKCYNFNGTNSYMTSTNKLIQGSDFSISCWAYTTTIASNQCICCTRTSIGAGVSVFILTGALRFDTGGTTQWNSGYTIPINTWVQITVTKTNNYKKLYINGNLFASTSSVGDMATISNTFAIGASHSDGTGWGNYFNGKINDLRVYDHALSEKEIKEISKAKILHYTFNDFQEPTENLMANLTMISTGVIDIGTDDIGPYFLKTSTEFGGIRVPNISVPAGSTYCISMEYMSDIAFSWSADFNEYSSNYAGNDASRTSATLYDNLYTTPGQWKRVYGIVNIVSDAINVQSLDIFHLPLSSPANNHKVYYRNAQFELKDHMTPYINGSRNGIIRDVSGYENDAILNLSSTPQWIDDSILGKGSYKFNKSHSITTSQLFFDNVNQCHTVSAWIYPELTLPTDSSSINSKLINFNSGYYIEFSSNYKTLEYLNSGVSDSYVYGNILPRNQWTLVTWILDTSNQTCKVYYNGVLHATSSNYINTDMPYGFSASTIFGESFTGKIDDIRIYATALSNDDILELYQIKASLDNIGNLYINKLDINEIGSSNNQVSYENWIEGSYNTNLIFYNNEKNNADGYNEIYSHSNFTNIIGNFLNPIGQIDRMIKYNVDTTHYIQYGHPTSNYYFNMDITKKYRFSQWIYCHKTAGTSTNQRNYVGIQSNTVCTLNSTVADANPYFTSPDMADANYMDKWVLWVYYIYPYSSTGNVNNGGIYYQNGTFIQVGNCFNWNTGYTSTNIRQYPIYEYAEVSAGSYVLHYRPRIDLCDGNEPSVEILLNCNEHRTLIDDNFKRMSFEKSSIGYFKSASELGPTNGLISYYPFDKNANDYGGKENHGTPTNNPVFISGIKNNCYSFDGTTNYINILHNTTLEPQNLTISAWINMDIDAPTVRNIFLTKWYGYSCEIEATTRRPYFRLNGPGDVYSSENLVPGQWYHFVGTFENGIGGKIYLNGVLKGTLSSTSPIAYSGSGVLNIGRYVGGVYFKGAIDEVRIYNRALSEEEIKILYDIYDPSGPKMKITKDNLYIKGEFKEKI